MNQVLSTWILSTPTWHVKDPTTSAHATAKALGEAQRGDKAFFGSEFKADIVYRKCPP